MATTVYLLCAITSAACAILLFRSWRAEGLRLVLWTALGFTGFAVNNLLLLVDRSLLTGTDLGLLRDLSGTVAVGVLLFGLVWESR
jgi:hypothetical protein